MKAFADLYAELDASTSTLHKVDALERYFRVAPPADAAWAVYFLAGGKPRQAVPSRVLRDAAREAAGLPEWLFEESYQAVGDLAETIAHLLPPGGEAASEGLADWIDRSHPCPCAARRPPRRCARCRRCGRSSTGTADSC